MPKALTSSEIASLEKRLRALLRSNEEVATGVEARGLLPSGEDHLPMEDEAVEATLLDSDLDALAIEQKVATQISAALQRVRAGTYGRCLACGRWISRSRLDILPYIATCSDCAH